MDNFILSHIHEIGPRSISSVHLLLLIGVIFGAIAYIVIYKWLEARTKKR